MTDTQMVMVPKVATDEMINAFIFSKCHSSELKYNLSEAIKASPNQGKVTPEMVEELADKISQYHEDGYYQYIPELTAALEEVFGLEIEK